MRRSETRCFVTVVLSASRWFRPFDRPQRSSLPPTSCSSDQSPTFLPHPPSIRCNRNNHLQGVTESREHYPPSIWYYRNTATGHLKNIQTKRLELCQQFCRWKKHLWDNTLTKTGRNQYHITAAGALSHARHCSEAAVLAPHCHRAHYRNIQHHPYNMKYVTYRNVKQLSSFWLSNFLSFSFSKNRLSLLKLH